MFYFGAGLTAEEIKMVLLFSGYCFLCASLFLLICVWVPHGFPERQQFSLLHIFFFIFQPEFIIIVNLESIRSFTNHYHVDYFTAVVLLLF